MSRGSSSKSNQPYFDEHVLLGALSVELTNTNKSQLLGASLFPQLFNQLNQFIIVLKMPCYHDERLFAKLSIGTPAVAGKSLYNWSWCFVYACSNPTYVSAVASSIQAPTDQP